MVSSEILQYFKNKKVFITGHTGFKGSWLTYLLASNGVEVVGFALKPNTQPNLYESLNLDNYCQSIIGDVNDLAHLEQSITQSHPDIVLHLAAQPLVRYSYANPIETFQTNVMGTANLLQACRSLTKKCSIVCITTDKVYHNYEWVYPYRENDRLGGYDPYSASKGAAEIVIDSYRKSFFSEGKIAVASARAGNVIGGGDWSQDRLIPDIIRSIATNESIVLRNPQAVRPWQHVLDPLFGYLQLAMKLDQEGQKYAQAWNFGPHANESLTVIQVCQMMVDTLGTGEIIVENEGTKLHEAGLLTLDISKAIHELGWNPVWDSKTAIKYTANWYLGNLNQQQTKALVEQDIHQFLSNESV